MEEKKEGKGKRKENNNNNNKNKERCRSYTAHIEKVPLASFLLPPLFNNFTTNSRSEDQMTPAGTCPLSRFIALA